MYSYTSLYVRSQLFSVLMYVSRAILFFMYAAFSSFFSRCNRLTVFNARCCTLFDDSAVFSLTQTNPFLVSLCLSGCHMITDRSLIAISQKSKYLQVLDLTKTKAGALYLRTQTKHAVSLCKSIHYIRNRLIEALNQILTLTWRITTPVPSQNLHVRQFKIFHATIRSYCF